MADWSKLSTALRSAGDVKRFTWAELDSLVGGLPASAANHRAWWSGDRPHVNAWRSAGYATTELTLGREVTFIRSGIRVAASTESAAVGATRADLDTEPASLLLVACVKAKAAAPAAARDLYVSPLFRKERDYAERSGVPWFILSAEHGLVAPDEWLAPYERYLPDTPRSFRSAWGHWVAERLELLAGTLDARTIEIHAGSAYVDALRGPLEGKGASLLEPLTGLTMGERLAWYGGPEDQRGDSPPAVATSAHASTEMFCTQLRDEGAALQPGEFLAQDPASLKSPGLYSWWVDQTGATELSGGLGVRLDNGLIYAGLAGATRWPSGRRSSNTLWSRISGMHLGGRHEFSTFRRTLGAVIASSRDESTIDEDALTTWMHEHLRVIAVPFEDADTLGRLEEDVLLRLDPPLNLKGMAKTALRRRVTELRRPHARKR